MKNTKGSSNLKRRVASAVAHYWMTRKTQSDKQVSLGRVDQGARAAVTGRAQMNGFITLFTELITEAGIEEKYIHHNQALELPGYFRPTKCWDLLVVKDDQLIIALEAKSQVGPSFGNNFNNRTEEAMGSAVDLLKAYREGALGKTVNPLLGYLFLLEDCKASRQPVRSKEPHFQVFPEFKNASYGKRYEIFCTKLVKERFYNVASFLLSDSSGGLRGKYIEPVQELNFEVFARALVAQAATFGGKKLL